MSGLLAWRVSERVSLSPPSVFQLASVAQCRSPCLLSILWLPQTHRLPSPPCFASRFPLARPLSPLLPSPVPTGSAPMARPGKLSLTSASLVRCTALWGVPPGLWHLPKALTLSPPKDGGHCSVSGRVSALVSGAEWLCPGSLLPDQKETSARWLCQRAGSHRCGPESVARTGC